MFLVHQISILELFLNGHVIMKYELLKIQLSHHINKYHFKIYKNDTKIVNLKCYISQYNGFTLFFKSYFHYMSPLNI